MSCPGEEKLRGFFWGGDPVAEVVRVRGRGEMVKIEMDGADTMSNGSSS